MNSPSFSSAPRRDRRHPRDHQQRQRAVLTAVLAEQALALYPARPVDLLREAGLGLTLDQTRRLRALRSVVAAYRRLGIGW